MRRAVVGLILSALVLLGAVILYSLALAGAEDPLFTVAHEIEIEAPPDRVWAVLSDFDRYPDWNPYAVRIEGVAEVGQKIRVTLVQDDWADPLVVEPTITRFEPGRGLAWHGRVLLPGIHETDHAFELSAIGGRRTRLRHSEEFRGWLARSFPAPEDRPAIERAFRAMNEALERRVESAR